MTTLIGSIMLPIICVIIVMCVLAVRMRISKLSWFIMALDFLAFSSTQKNYGEKTGERS